MADFESNGVLVSDADSRESSPLDGEPAEVKQEQNKSNSSVSDQNEKSKPVRQKSLKQASGRQPEQMHTKDFRRNEILEKQKHFGHTMDGRTKAFMEHLLSQHTNSKSKMFKNQLMLPENMETVPSSFAKNWTLLVTPVGSRCLVVANKGYTGAYTKSGYHIISHPSNLPNGNKVLFREMPGPCVLDCIYSEEVETYYVLDVMCWEGQPLYACDTQTRFRLLQEKLRECDASRLFTLNPYPFVALRSFTPTKNNISDAVKLAPYMVEGLVFYHKQLLYTPGLTPLMLWLTLDRLPSKMKIEIPELGLVMRNNYSDPVALALACGVSPAIITQAYPQASVRQQLRHQQQSRDGSGMQHDEALFLATCMMQNLNVQPRGRQWSQNRGHQLMAGPDPMYGYSGYNENHNNNNYNNGMGGGRPKGQGRFALWSQYQQHQHKQQERKKKKKAQQSAQKKKVQRDPNWEHPHGVMRSEWMGEAPANLEQDYLTCICPMAKRRIIVASQGSTCTYNKYGKLVEVYTSSLPSGSSASESGGKQDDLTILDCLWCGSYQKFFVIDVMHWKQQPFYEAEAEFRFFWLVDKFSGVILKSGDKEYPVELLPKYPSTRDSVTSALASVEYKVDGLLCFEKKSKYSRSAGANALWLKLDMMEDLMGYPPPEQVNFKPSTEKERNQRDYFLGLKAGNSRKPEEDETEIRSKADDSGLESNGPQKVEVQ